MKGQANDEQTLGAATAVGKSLSKAVYVFSPDEETGKVAHVNYVPKEILSSKKLDAKVWLTEVSKVIGGKGGGKDDSATGVGSEGAKINEAVEEARRVYKSRVEA